MNHLDVSYQGKKVGTLAEARGGIFTDSCIEIASGNSGQLMT